MDLKIGVWKRNEVLTVELALKMQVLDDCEVVAWKEVDARC